MGDAWVVGTQLQGHTQQQDARQELVRRVCSTLVLTGLSQGQAVALILCDKSCDVRVWHP